MEIFVYDRNIDFQGIIEKFSSLRWVRRYHRPGTFELHCVLTPETLKLLKVENIIWIRGKHEAGYIEYRNITQKKDGTEKLVVMGKFLTGYLDRRIVWDMETLNMTAEQAMRRLVLNNAISPVDSSRKIDGLILGETKEYAQKVDKQYTGTNLLDALEDLSVLSGLGYRTLFDLENKQLIFDVYEGVNRSSNQYKNPNALFSSEFDNIFEQEYTDSLHNYRNVVLVAGEGEGIDRERVSIGSSDGLDRYELYVDARDLQSTSIEDGEEVSIPIEQYRDMLLDRGRSKLSEYTKLKTFDAKINHRSNLRYQEDFDLGDIVTVTSKKWGVTVDTRITEIEEVYEPNKYEINTVFGNRVPTLIDKIKQAVI